MLLDVAAARGVTWYRPDEYVTVADFEAAEKRQRVRVESGDAIFVRTGMERMEAEQGEQDIYPRAGLHAECAEWMHTRQVSVYGGDCIEKLPYPSESFSSAIHMIVLASMGLPILDWPALDRAGADLRAPRPLGVPPDYSSSAATWRHRVADRPAVHLLRATLSRKDPSMGIRVWLRSSRWPVTALALVLPAGQAAQPRAVRHASALAPRGPRADFSSSWYGSGHEM